MTRARFPARVAFGKLDYPKATLVSPMASQDCDRTAFLGRI